MEKPIFLKLGGSLITDKGAEEALRADVLARLAVEIAAVLKTRPQLPLVIGHGSGSFGHVAAARYDTRQGVQTAEQWRGFAAVSEAAARLHALVRRTLLDAGVPVVGLQPSASAVCRDGTLISMSRRPVRLALRAGLVPLLYGDVAFDVAQGGTIISTEQVLAFLVPDLRPEWLLLAGETEGVYDEERKIVPAISRANLPELEPALGGSRGTDVTGGMAAKVRQMLALTDEYPELRVRLFSGLVEGRLREVLLKPEQASGTLIWRGER